MKTVTRLVPALMMVCLLTTPAAWAQDAAPGGGGGRGNFDPAQFRQRMLDGIKTQLKASDEEWTVLQPKLEAVMEAQRSMRPSFGGRRGGFGGRGGDSAGGNAPAAPAPTDRPQTDMEKASAALRDALQAENTPPADLAAKLAAVRDARAKAQASLTAARDQIKVLLTPRQEAVLVMMGMLE